jgi:uncharacterized protein (DUF3084 family)
MSEKIGMEAYLRTLKLTKDGMYTIPTDKFTTLLSNYSKMKKEIAECVEIERIYENLKKKISVIIADSKIARQERDTVTHEYNMLLNELIKIRNEKEDVIQERDKAIQERDKAIRENAKLVLQIRDALIKA